MGGGDVGTFMLSVDLELDLEHQDAALEQRLDQVRSRLVELTRSYAVPATWAVADPSLSAATESIAAAHCGHEMAVLGERAWLGTGCGRARLARELARRFTGARRSGVPVSTLALRDVEQVLDLDLLLDHGVTAVRGPAIGKLSLARKLAPPPIRFGIWHPPAAWKVRAESHWWSPAAWTIRREIKRSIRRRSVVHLAVDAGQLVASGDSLLEVLESTFRYAAAKRESGQLEIATIGQLATRALQDRSAVPSRSILRPAA
jgi:hypothetical protein